MIPGDAEATLDVRAVPDENMDGMLPVLRRLIDSGCLLVIRLALH